MQTEEHRLLAGLSIDKLTLTASKTIMTMLKEQAFSPGGFCYLSGRLAPASLGGAGIEMLARACIECQPRVRSGTALNVVATGGESGARTLWVTPLLAIMTSTHTAVTITANRAVTGCGCGAFAESDIMSQLLGVSSYDLEQQLRVGRALGLFFASVPHLYPVISGYSGMRASLGVRDFFKVAVILADPTRSPLQWIACYESKTAALMAHALSRLSHVKRAMVVSATSGIDELSPYAESHAYLVTPKQVRKIVLGRRSSSGPVLPLGHGQESRISLKDECQALRHYLEGAQGPWFDTAVLNYASVLVLLDPGVSWTRAKASARERLLGGEGARQIERVKDYLHAGR